MKLKFLLKRGIDLYGVIQTQIGHNPYDKTRNKFKQVENGLLLRFKSWQILFELSDGNAFIKDINSGLRIIDKTTVMKYFSRLCNTFSFTTSQTLAYLMNNLCVYYLDIPYNKRIGKSKVKLVKDSLKTMKYIVEAGVYYNPLKIFSFLSIMCIIMSIIGFLFSHFASIKAGYILGIGGMLVSVIVFSLGLLAILLKQIMDKE